MSEGFVCLFGYWAIGTDKSEGFVCLFSVFGDGRAVQHER